MHLAELAAQREALLAELAKVRAVLEAKPKRRPGMTVGEYRREVSRVMGAALYAIDTRNRLQGDLAAIEQRIADARRGPPSDFQGADKGQT
jgi:ribosomal protein L29